MKRYQVFISSTYTDLKEERSAVLKSVLKLRHIPVGMEHFVASNEEQFNYIKRLLDDTDYYIVIVGNRYGSVADDGLSYTEKEFDYAVSLGIPIIACVHSNPGAFPLNRSDTDKKSIEKLCRFREKIMKSRLISYIDWSTPEALSSEVVVALVNMINDYPRQGWERAGSYNNSDLLGQINELRLDNDKLKAKIKEFETSTDYKIEMVRKFPWGKTPDIKGHPTGVLYGGDYLKSNIEVKLSWKQIFEILGCILLVNNTSQYAKSNLDIKLFGINGVLHFELSDEDFELILTELARFGLVSISDGRIHLEKEARRILCSEEIILDEILEPIHQQVLDVVGSEDDRMIKKLIEEMRQFERKFAGVDYSTLVRIDPDFLSRLLCYLSHSIKNDESHHIGFENALKLRNGLEYPVKKRQLEDNLEGVIRFLDGLLRE